MRRNPWIVDAIDLFNNTDGRQGVELLDLAAVAVDAYGVIKEGQRRNADWLDRARQKMKDADRGR